jgi:hypothetical protein
MTRAIPAIPKRRVDQETFLVDGQGTVLGRGLGADSGLSHVIILGLWWIDFTYADISLVLSH